MGNLEKKHSTQIYIAGSHTNPERSYRGISVALTPCGGGSRSVAKRGDLPAVSDYSSGKWPLVDSLIIGE